MSDASRGGKRRGVLDADRRLTIISMLANGSSRRTAAWYVGCAPSTITNTALRDPEFAAQLHQAEHNGAIEALHALRNAARQPRYWRSAAWILERKNPEDFARRGPDTVTEEQLDNLLIDLAALLAGDATEENCQRAIRRFDALILDLRAADSPEPLEEFFDASPSGEFDSNP